MAGDSLRDAFRSELAAIVNAAGILWEVIDQPNTAENPDTSTGILWLEFPGASEDEFTFGNPAGNLYREAGQVTIRAASPLGRYRNVAESYAETIRAAFRMRRFAAGARTIRIDSTAPLGNGFTDGGMWAESLALAYSVINDASL